MANERITEEFVRDYFKSDAQFKSIKFEEQKSNNKTINGLLNGQSKTGGKGNGFPEFILSFPTDSRYLIVVECKASPTKHESQNRNNPKDYAVDGVLHYTKALSSEFDVIAIGVSGETKTELQVSHFLWKKGANNYTELDKDKKLLPIHDYLDVFDNVTFRDNFYTSDIISKAIELNEEFQAYSIPEMVRCTVVSAILLALIHKPFHTSFEIYPNSNSLGKAIIGAIDAELDEPNDIVRNKAEMITEYSKLLNEPLFKELTIKHKDKKTPTETITIAKEFIKYLKDYVFPLVKHSNVGYDVLGRFYTEFIRYAGSQQKQGLVLTPSHITNLFCDLLHLNVNDTIYDPCCGTGGFLVSAMTRLFQLAGNDSLLKERIRKEQITGVELRTDMFTYACAGMRLRGDGRSNLYRGSCFDLEGAVKNRKPTVAMLNPPYDHGSAAQMEFIEHALNVVSEQNGRVAAIVQMSCAIKNETKLIEVKSRLLQKHHLVAVLSMPDDLFYPIGVVTCIMVFQANKPNLGLKTWFGYFKDDGLEKKKYLGRIDTRGRYKEIKEHWLSSFNNKEEVPGLSVCKKVNANDEWCAEAYMETDYSSISELNFIEKMKNYAAFLIQTENL